MSHNNPDLAARFYQPDLILTVNDVLKEMPDKFYSTQLYERLVVEYEKDTKCTCTADEREKLRRRVRILIPALKRKKAFRFTLVFHPDTNTPVYEIEKIKQ